MKNLFSFLLVLLLTLGLFPSATEAYTANDFVIKIKTDKDGASNSTSFTFDAAAGVTYDIDWGDASPLQVGVEGPRTHDYGVAGEYTIAATGLTRAAFTSDPKKILRIDQWGASAWTSMNSMFKDVIDVTMIATDNPDLSGVSDLTDMFRGATNFNGDISGWNTTNVTNMSGMFDSADSFNQDIGSWDTGNVTNMDYMFLGAWAFNQDIGSWNTVNLVDSISMFNRAASFNQDLNLWDTSNIRDMAGMFRSAANFNGDVSVWDTSSVTDMNNMFNGSSVFNQDLSLWNTSSVTDMSGMFSGSVVFNQDIGNWNTSSVTNTSIMFSSALSFDQDISFKAGSGNGGGDAWSTSGVTDMSFMFLGANSFNKNIGNWDTSLVLNMTQMFHQARSFNQDIGNWNTSNVTDMSTMFRDATVFNQNIDAWDVAAVTTMADMFTDAPAFSSDNYDLLLTGWSAQVVRPGVVLSTMSAAYCTGKAGHDLLTTTHTWVITDGGEVCSVVTNVPSKSSSRRSSAAVAKAFGPEVPEGTTTPERQVLIEQLNTLKLQLIELLKLQLIELQAGR